MGLSIDVVIPTHNGWELLERCLGCLRTQTAPHSVYVVDNASTDGTADRLRVSFPNCHVLEIGQNLGFSGACNRGAASGGADVIVLLNNDVEAPPDFLEQLVRPLVSNAGTGSVASLLLRPGGRIIDSLGLTADPTLAGFPRLRGHAVSDADHAHAVLAGPCGAAGAYRRQAWDEVGGLDDGVLGYGEDLDFALRLGTAGWETEATTAAIATHVGSASFGRRSPWQRYHGGFSRGYFLRRYRVLRTRHCPRALTTEAIVVLGDALMSRDLSAARGRLAGWHAARGLSTRPRPSLDIVDYGITFRRSLGLRREVYAT